MTASIDRLVALKDVTLKGLVSSNGGATKAAITFMSWSFERTHQDAEEAARLVLADYDEKKAEINLIMECALKMAQYAVDKNLELKYSFTKVLKESNPPTHRALATLDVGAHSFGADFNYWDEETIRCELAAAAWTERFEALEGAERAQK
jgi:hypothetical protein